MAAGTEDATEITAASLLPRVTVIVVNWNGKDNTCECLESLRKMTYPCTDVIVVDNASADGSVDAIRERFPEVTVIEAERNRGTAGGRNLGLECALPRGADYVLFLDNDAIADSQLISSLLRAADEIKGHAILGSKIYYFDKPKKIWYAGSKWQNPGFVHLGMGDTDDGQKFNSIAETAYACGCALFVDRTTLEAVGVLDEKYFAYFEETDFCYRAKRAGFRCYFVPSAVVWHKVSSSSGREGSPVFHYFMSRNTLLWAERHLSPRDKFKLYKVFIQRILQTVRPPKIGLSQAGLGQRAGSSSGSPGSYKEACRQKYSDPAGKAMLMGIRDYLLRRFGDCPATVKALRR